MAALETDLAPHVPVPRLTITLLPTGSFDGSPAPASMDVDELHVSSVWDTPNKSVLLGSGDLKAPSPLNASFNSTAGVQSGNRSKRPNPLLIGATPSPARNAASSPFPLENPQFSPALSENRGMLSDAPPQRPANNQIGSARGKGHHRTPTFSAATEEDLLLLSRKSDMSDKPGDSGKAPKISRSKSNRLLTVPSDESTRATPDASAARSQLRQPNVPETSPSANVQSTLGEATWSWPDRPAATSPLPKSRGNPLLAGSPMGQDIRSAGSAPDLRSSPAVPLNKAFHEVRAIFQGGSEKQLAANDTRVSEPRLNESRVSDTFPWSPDERQFATPAPSRVRSPGTIVAAGSPEESYIAEQTFAPERSPPPLPERLRNRPLPQRSPPRPSVSSDSPMAKVESRSAVLNINQSAKVETKATTSSDGLVGKKDAKPFAGGDSPMMRVETRLGTSSDSPMVTRTLSDGSPFHGNVFASKQADEPRPLESAARSQSHQALTPPRGQSTLMPSDKTPPSSRKKPRANPLLAAASPREKSEERSRLGSGAILESRRLEGFDDHCVVSPPLDPDPARSFVRRLSGSPPLGRNHSQPLMPRAFPFQTKKNTGTTLRSSSSGKRRSDEFPRSSSYRAEGSTLRRSLSRSREEYLQHYSNSQDGANGRRSSSRSRGCDGVHPLPSRTSAQRTTGRRSFSCSGRVEDGCSGQRGTLNVSRSSSRSRHDDEIQKIFDQNERRSQSRNRRGEDGTARGYERRSLSRSRLDQDPHPPCGTRLRRSISRSRMEDDSHESILVTMFGRPSRGGGCPPLGGQAEIAPPAGPPATGLANRDRRQPMASPRDPSLGECTGPPHRSSHPETDPPHMEEVSVSSSSGTSRRRESAPQRNSAVLDSRTSSQWGIAEEWALRTSPTDSAHAGAGASHCGGGLTSVSSSFVSVSSRGSWGVAPLSIVPVPQAPGNTGRSGSSRSPADSLPMSPPGLAHPVVRPVSTPQRPNDSGPGFGAGQIPKEVPAMVKAQIMDLKSRVQDLERDLAVATAQGSPSGPSSCEIEEPVAESVRYLRRQMDMVQTQLSETMQEVRRSSRQVAELSRYIFGGAFEEVTPKGTHVMRPSIQAHAFKPAHPVGGSTVVACPRQPLRDDLPNSVRQIANDLRDDLPETARQWPRRGAQPAQGVAVQASYRGPEHRPAPPPVGSVPPPRVCVAPQFQQHAGPQMVQQHMLPHQLPLQRRVGEERGAEIQRCATIVRT